MAKPYHMSTHKSIDTQSARTKTKVGVALTKAWAKPHFRHIPKLHNAFKSQFVHGDLQVTMHIAFCCILNRHLSQNSHCWCSWFVFANSTYYCIKLHPMQSNETTCITKRDPQGKYLAHRHQIQARHNTHTPIANTNDPSAGSPTETLLRLLLPLSNKVHDISPAKFTHGALLQSK